MSGSKLDLFAQLLEAAKKGTTSAHIASQAGIHQELVHNSLCFLADLSLLKKAHNSPISFITTPKGLQFLDDYRHLKTQLSLEGSTLEKP